MNFLWWHLPLSQHRKTKQPSTITLTHKYLACDSLFAPGEQLLQLLQQLLLSLALLPHFCTVHLSLNQPLPGEEIHTQLKLKPCPQCPLLLHPPVPAPCRQQVLGSRLRKKITFHKSLSYTHTHMRQLILASFHFVTFPLQTLGLNLSLHPKQLQ